MDDVVVLEDVKPTAESEEVGLMKKEPTVVELAFVAFQEVLVSVLIVQVMVEKFEGREVASEMYANPDHTKLLVRKGLRRGREKYRLRFHTRQASQRYLFRMRR